MNCPKCGEPISKKDSICPNCGKKLKHPFRALFITSLIFLLAMGVVITAFWFKGGSPEEAKQATKEDSVTLTKKDKDSAKVIQEKAEKKTQSKSDTEEQSSATSDDYIQGEEAASEDQPKMEKQTMELEQKEDLTDYINSAKEAVFTVTTPEMQGSGFLYNANGAIVTNAHVIEGWTEATVHSSTGQSYTGKVIGYSNKTDVAVIQVPELAGKQPFPLDRSSSINIGDEIVALGSPLGEENTATMGFLTGMNRDFVIGTFSYDHLFQISAPTAPGSSGGPLISKNSKKIIAINSAQSTSNVSVGFSIPLSQVSSLIDGWISSPMDEKQLLAQFYGMDGELVFGDDWESEEGYFEDGDVSEDKDHYEYWEYGYDDYWKDKGKDTPVQQPTTKPDGSTTPEQTKPATGVQTEKPAENTPSQPAEDGGQKPAEETTPSSEPKEKTDIQKQDVPQPKSNTEEPKDIAS